MDVNCKWDRVRAEDVPPNTPPLSSRWVFKTKELPDGGIRHQAWLIIRGCVQTAGLDYDADEIYAPVAKLQSLRILLALAAIEDCEIDQMDVVTAFLNPEIDGGVYMKIPDGLPSTGQVCKLRKSLYGQKTSTCAMVQTH